MDATTMLAELALDWLVTIEADHRGYRVTIERRGFRHCYSGADLECQISRAYSGEPSDRMDGESRWTR